MVSVTLVDAGSARGEINEPLAIEALAGAMRATCGARVLVHLVSLQVAQLESSLPRIAEADVVGVSVPIGSRAAVCGLLNSLGCHSRRAARPLVVLGGTLPTFAPASFLAEYPDVICVRGEGEHAIVGILDCLSGAEPTSLQDFKQSLLRMGVPNLVFTMGEALVHTPRRCEDLSALPPPFRDLLPDVVRRGGIVRIEGSRGCPWSRCTFCSVAAKYGQGGWRPFPVSRIVAELGRVSEMGARSPWFTDEDFLGGDRGRALSLATEIQHAKHDGRIAADLTFFASTSAGSIMRCAEGGSIERLFRDLRAAGLREVFLGLESGSSRQLQRYCKGVTPDQNARVLRFLATMGLSVDVGFIMFDPEMTLSDLGDNLRFIRQMHLDGSDARLGKSLRVLPETPLALRLQRTGLLVGELNTDQLLYPYRFHDPMVQIVFDVFDDWEAESLEEIYALQGRTRGEIARCGAADVTEHTLRRLRSLDIEFLEECVLAVSGGGVVTRTDLRRRVEVTRQVSSRRRLLLSRMPRASLEPELEERALAPY